MGCPINPVETIGFLVARLRDAAREAERVPLARELTRIADELLAVRKSLMAEPASALAAVPDYDRNARTRVKNPAPGTCPGTWRCSVCRSVLPVSMFSVTDPKTGKLRAECKPCFNDRQRTRYVRAGQAGRHRGSPRRRPLRRSSVPGVRQPVRTRRAGARP
jgi:hypothetical protein